MSEQAYLQDLEDTSYLLTNLVVGTVSLGAGLAKLGISLTKHPKTNVLERLRVRRTNLERDNHTRQTEPNRIVNARYAELERQGHGPQRHDGDVTRQMLEDRVLKGIDPMVHTDPIKAAQVRSKPTRYASRIISRHDYVTAERTVRRSSEYAQARDLALEWLTEPTRDSTRHSVGKWQVDGTGEFSVRLPITDVLGPDSTTRIEGLARIGSAKNPKGVRVIDFSEGEIVAIYRFPRDQTNNITSGEPILVTLFPKGIR